MANLNLTNQHAEKNDIMPSIQRLNQLMQQWKPIWDKASKSKRKKWVLSKEYPIMNLAYNIYKNLDDNFFNVKYYKE